MTKKFSQFIQGNIPQTTDIIVGLRAGNNTQFDFGGINDPFGHPIVSYEYYNEFSRNYIRFINSPMGAPVVIEAQGIDADVSLTVSSKENGDLNLVSPNAGSVNIIIGGSGDITMTTHTGKFILNETEGIDAVLDEDNMASDSATAVPTQQSVKAYVDSSSGALSNLTYITDTDETADLPNSFQLLGTTSQITASSGVIGLSTAIETPGTFKIGAMGATVSSISTDGTLSSDSDMLIVTEKAVKTYVDGTQTLIKAKTYVTNTNETATLPNSQPLSLLSTGIVAVTTATGILSSVTLTGTANEIDVSGGNGAGTPTFSLPNTLIAPGTFQATTSINIGGAGATVTSISTDGTLAANSDALLSTQKAIKTYVDAQGGASVTLTNAGVAVGTQSAVNDGTGPSLAIKGFVGGTGITTSSNGTDVAITNTAPDQTVIITNSNGLTVGGTYPNFTIGITAPISIANGGTNTTSPIGYSGTLAQSDGDKYTFTTATYPATATATGTILRADGTNWSASTSTFADTYAVSTLLYAASTNAVSELATTNRASLSTNATGVPTWLALTDGQLVIGSTAGAPTAATLSAGTGISITNGAASITIAATGVGTWTEVTGTSQSMAVNTSYIANNGSLVTLTLPTTAALGDFILVDGKGAGLYKIAQNASQVIHTGTTDTTTGTGGSLTATNRYDCIRLRCITANTDWVIETIKGAFTIV